MRTAGIARPLPSSPRAVTGKLSRLAPNLARTRKAVAWGIDRIQQFLYGSSGSGGTRVFPQPPKGSPPRGRPPLVIPVRLSWLERGTARDQALSGPGLPSPGESKPPPLHWRRRTSALALRAPLPALGAVNAGCVPGKIGRLAGTSARGLPHALVRGDPKREGPRASRAQDS
jgi:hypothetical protein